MKLFIAFALLSLGALAQASNEEVCHNKVVDACQSESSGGSVCTATFAGIEHIKPEVQSYMHYQLEKSYEYLLLATHFNSYQKNRPGFNKLYQDLSDRAFDESIALIKQLTRRGATVDLNAGNQEKKATHTLEVDELHSLALALDIEKELAIRAGNVHTHATHGSKRSTGQKPLASKHSDLDPEMAHFFEEKYLSKQAESVRKLSGYVNDLAKLMTVPDPSLSVYLFDEYLQKQ